MNSKSAVDRHVSHLLSKCNSAKERKSLGLEISQLYIDVKDFKTAKGYLERYIQLDKQSRTAFLLLASVNEELGDINAAIHAYKAAFELGQIDDLLLAHVCNLVSSNHLSSSDLEYWSSLANNKGISLIATTGKSNNSDVEKRLTLIETQLNKDPNDSDLCMKLMDLLSEIDSDRTFNHCLNCINLGRHFDRPEWFRRCVQSLDVSSVNPPSEDLRYLEIISRMLLLRLVASSESQSKFFKLLESLHSKIHLLPLEKKFVRFRNVSESWLSFYSAVYIQRFFSTEDIMVSNVVYEHYRRSIELLKSEPEQNSEPFSSHVWNVLHLFQQEHFIQAWCLVNSIPKTRKNLHLESSTSWDELMDRVHRSTSPTKIIPGEATTTFSTPIVEIDGDEFWFHCRDALVEAPNNLALLLWACCHLSTNDSSVNDTALSNERLNFIFTFVSAAFPRLELASFPLPAAPRSRNTALARADGLCQLDLICFLMSCLIHLIVRTLSHAEVDARRPDSFPAIGTEWLRLPVSLLPTHAVPLPSQRQWWEVTMDVVGKNTLQSLNPAKPTRTSMTFFQCGLNQLRLLARSTRCFGNQSGVFATPLLFRVAAGLTRFGEQFASSRPKVHILNWANGFWHCALQQQAFGPAPPNSVLAAQTNRSLPACCGSSSLLVGDNSRLSSPSSPLRSASQSAPGSPASNHSLFALPNSSNWWLGLGQPFHPVPSVLVSRWYNDGLLFCLTRLEAAYQTHGQQFTADEKYELRLLVRLLDQTKIEVACKAYSLAGQLLLRYAEQAQASVDDGASLDANAGRFLLGDNCDPLSDLERAHRYLRLATTYEIDEDNQDGNHRPKVLNSENKEPESPGPTMSSRLRNSPLDKSSHEPRSTHRTAMVPASEGTQTPASRLSVMRPLYDLFEAFEGCKLVGPTTCTPLTGRGTTFPSTEAAASNDPDVELDSNIDQFQELLMASLMNNWQSLINGLSSQLTETKTELSRSRQLNEQLSNQLHETSKQLSETMTKFIEFQTQMSCVAKAGRDTASVHDSLTGPIHELSQAISELRRWLPEGMAAAATAAVQAHMTFANPRQPTPPRPTPLMNGVDAATLMHLYGSNISMGQTHFAPLHPMPVQSLPPNWRMSAAAAGPVAPGVPSFGDLKQFQKPGTMPTQNPWADAISGVRFGDVNSPTRPDQSGLLQSHGGTGSAFPAASYGWSGSSPPNRDTSHSFQSDSQTEALDMDRVKLNQQQQPAAAPAPFTSMGSIGFGSHSVSLPTHVNAAHGQQNKPGNTSSPATDKERLKPMPEPSLFRPPVTVASSSTGSTNQEKDSKTADPVHTKLGLSGFNPWAKSDSSTPSVTTGSGTTVATAHSEKPGNDVLARFAPKPGEWSCSACLLQNSAANSSCVACQTPKDGSTEKNKPSSVLTAPAVSSASLLSKFTPQPGSWDCPTCMLNHPATVETCPACQSRKPGLSVPASGDTVSTSKPSTTSLFGGFNVTGARGFVFGQQQQQQQQNVSAPTVSTPNKPLFSFVASGAKSPVMPSPGTAIPFGIGSQANIPTTGTTLTDNQGHTDSGSRPVFYFGKDHPGATTKSADSDLSKPSGVFDKLELTGGSNTKPIFGSGGFSFNFGLPRTTESSSAGVTNVSNVANASGDDADQVELVDEDKLTFKPVLDVMPERIEVRTGEENEEVVFCERAKLYRWTSDTWRERGVGEIKLLRTPTTGAVRCLMRRDHVLKVCCNHPVTAGMQLKPMTSAADGRAWTWWAIDFTEPAADADRSTSSEANAEVDVSGGRPETFAVRFKSSEHAQAFRAAFQDAVSVAEKRTSGNSSDQVDGLLRGLKDVDIDQDKHHSDSDDVVVLEKPLEVNNEQLARARQLMLPDEFYSFENGVVRGESEHLTAKEEAEEDALLDAAVHRGAQSHQTEPQSTAKPICTQTPAAASVDDKQGSATKIQSTPDINSQQQQPAVAVSNSLTSGLFGSLSLTPQDTKTTQATTVYVPQSRGLPDFSSLSASVSKDSKPSWVTPSAPSSTNANVWATAGTPLFAKSAPTEPTETGENGTADESGEHDPHYEPIIALPELVQTKSGEENEVCLFLKRCRVYRWTDQAWKERGVGEMKVLVQPKSIPAGYQPGGRDILPDNVELDGVQRARLLMRRDQVLKLCVNQPIGVDLPQFTPMSSGGKGMCWVGEDYSEGSGTHEKLAIRFKHASEAEEFKAAVARAQACLAKSASQHHP